MPHTHGRCLIGTPDATRLRNMQDECVSKWMVRMSEPESCVSYFSGVASPACSSSDLVEACAETSKHFTKRDAEKLCRNLQIAHSAFWPHFWSNDHGSDCHLHSPN